jgi:16S rRNA processing protein RimM
VGRPHGLDGSFYVTRPVARLLWEGTVVTVGGDRRVAIARRAGTDARPIVRLEGFDGRQAAEALRGAELTVEGVEAPALEQGEFWAHELEGCAVVAGDRTIGRVTGLLELPSCEALEVAPDHGDAPVLVPMVRDAILAVDVGERKIEVDLEFLDLPT